jgi:hypothetical protein
MIKYLKLYIMHLVNNLCYYQKNMDHMNHTQIRHLVKVYYNLIYGESNIVKRMIGNN